MLLAAIAKGRRWLDDIASGAASDIESIAAREGLSERSARMILSLAFLAPNIVKAAFNGTPRGFGVSRLTDLPARWNEQRQRLGLAISSCGRRRPAPTVPQIEPTPSHDSLSRGFQQSS
jgi:site-specific DNA recombinase